MKVLVAGATGFGTRTLDSYFRELSCPPSDR